MNVFDNIDVQYLVDNLTPQQLRWEIHLAHTRQALANQWLGTRYEHPEDRFPHQEYAKACLEALKIVRSQRPNPQPIRGRINVEELKARTDIVEVVERYTTLRKAGKNFTGCCPIHGDKHPSLTVYPDQQSWYCYGCNRGGDVIAFVQAVENTDFRGATTILGGQ